MCKVMELTNCSRGIAVMTKDGRKMYGKTYSAEEAGCCVPNKKNSAEAYEAFLAEEEMSEDDIAYWYLAIDRDDDTVYISDHAMDRMRKRLGWNKNAALRMTKKVFEEGRGIEETKGALRTWLEEKIDKNRDIYRGRRCAPEFRIYGSYIFLFDRGILVTVYDMGSVEKHNEKRQKIHEGSGHSAMKKKKKWA